MKPHKFIAACLFIALFAITIGIAPSTRGVSAETGINASKTNSATTNGVVEIPVPAAIFNVTNSNTHDPFFPHSLRHPVEIVTNLPPAYDIHNFVLRGIDGSAHKRLAMVNNRTLAVGEETEITTESGKVKIQCVEIKDKSVVIRADGQPESLEIYLRKTAQ